MAIPLLPAPSGPAAPLIPAPPTLLVHVGSPTGAHQLWWQCSCPMSHSLVCCLTCCCQTTQILDYRFSTWKRGAGSTLSDFWSLSWVDQWLEWAETGPYYFARFLQCPFLLFLRFICHVQLCFLKSYTSVDSSVSALRYQKVYLWRYCRSVSLVYCRCVWELSWFLHVIFYWELDNMDGWL